MHHWIIAIELFSRLQLEKSFLGGNIAISKQGGMIWL
jgi:hypothetical protein